MKTRTEEKQKKKRATATSARVVNRNGPDLDRGNRLSPIYVRKITEQIELTRTCGTGRFPSLWSSSDTRLDPIQVQMPKVSILHGVQQHKPQHPDTGG